MLSSQCIRFVVIASAFGLLACPGRSRSSVPDVAIDTPSDILPDMLGVPCGSRTCGDTHLCVVPCGCDLARDPDCGRCVALPESCGGQPTCSCAASVCGVNDGICDSVSANVASCRCLPPPLDGIDTDAADESPPDALINTDSGFATDAPTDARVSDRPRLIAPLSTSIVTSQRPRLHWVLPPGADGARIELCRDRGCSGVIATVDAPGDSALPPAELPAGIVFWRARSTSAGVIGVDVSATWEFVVGHRTAPIDTISGAILDVNGDGFVDVAIGNSGGSDPTIIPQIEVHYGGPAGLEPIAARVLLAPDGNDGWGVTTGNLGDVNGDGFGDLVVGNGYVSAGRAYVYFGSPTGVRGYPDLTLEGTPGVDISFGHAADGAGDVDRDGYGDLLVGSAASPIMGSMNGPGRVYVYGGGPSGPDLAPVATLTGPDGNGGFFGAGARRAGDVDGDGFADIVVAAWWAPGTNRAPGPGRAYVYTGSAGGIVTSPFATLSGGVDNDHFSEAISCAGDMDGDGRSDLIIGAHYAPYDSAGDVAGPGRAYLYFGATLAGVIDPSQVLLPPVPGDFGLSVSGMGDIDGDGLADVVVGAGSAVPDRSSPDYRRGAVSLYKGLLGSHFAAYDRTLLGPDGASGVFGARVLDAGDINGDGFAEIVVAAPAVQHVFVFNGSPRGVDSVLSVMLVGDPRSLFGSALAFAPAFPMLLGTRATNVFGG